MTLTAPPPAVEALRDMLLACAAVTSAGIATGSIWYPAAAFDPDAGSADALPAILIVQEGVSRSSYAAGAQGLPGGSLTATVFLSGASSSIGAVEDLANDIAQQLMGQSTGLPITTVDVDPAQSITRGQVAGGVSFYCCTISLTWGLS